MKKKIICGLVMLVLLLLGPAVVNAAWWNGSWTYQKQINRTGETTVIDDFTIYLMIEKEAGMNANYSDLRFVNSSEDGLLPAELAWSNSTHAGVYVLLPSLSTGTNTLYMYYGNPGASWNFSNSSAWGSQWSHIFHFEDNACDSITGNCAVANLVSGNNYALDSGIIFNKNANLTGSTASNISTDTIISFSTNRSSIIFWGYRGSTLSTENRFLTDGDDSDIVYPTSTSFRCGFRDGGGNYKSEVDTISSNTWYYIGCIANLTTGLTYMNGALESTVTPTSGGIYNDYPDGGDIGRTVAQQNADYKFDELYVSTTRNIIEDEMKAYYQNNNLSRTIFGAEQSTAISASATVSPSSPLTDERIEGNCTGIEPGGNNVTFNWTWYINDAEFSAGNISYYTAEGISINVANLSPDNTSYGDNITFSCLAYNGSAYSEWANSTTIFIANSGPNQPSLNYPGNGYANVSTEAVLNITVTDQDGHAMNVSFYNSSGDLIGTATDIANGSIASVTWSGLYIGTNYSWYANITDGINTTQSPLWNFTTFAAYIIIVPDGYYNQSDTFILNISKSGVISDINATLMHNGTAYAPTKTESGDYFIFTRSITPLATGELEAYWAINLTDGAAIRPYNISSNQTVIDWAIDNCSLSNNVTMTMTIYSENTPTSTLNGSVEIEFTYWINDATKQKIYSHSFNGSYTYSLCLAPHNATIRADAYILYTVPSGFTHRYYIVNGSFTNTTQNISLYNFDSDTGISDLKITTRYQTNNNYFPNVIAKLERLYVSESVWRTVQMDESGDFGQIFFNIKEENTDYRIIFQDRNNNILKTTEKMKFICTSGICDITFLLPTEAENATEISLNISWNYDNNSHQLNISWEEVYGIHTMVSYLLTKETMTGPATICSGSQTGAAGNMSCDTSAYSGLVYLYINPGIGAWIELGRTTLTDFLGETEGAFWAFGISLTTAAFGIFSPMAAIIGLCFGLIATYLLGIFTPITMTFIIIACVLGIAIGIKVRY